LARMHKLEIEFCVVKNIFESYNFSSILQM